MAEAKGQSAGNPGQPGTALGIPKQRWIQLFVGIVCMVMIANMQYGWTLFVPPILKKYGWAKDSLQWAFTLFVLFETWPIPLLGFVKDKIGPRFTVLGGGLLIGAAWYMNGVVDTLTGFYVAAIIGGLGAGAVYSSAVGNALKWFPDRRGLAAGLTAAGFGAGSAASVIPIANMIKESGYEHTFIVFGLGQGIAVVLLSLLLSAPKPGQLPAATTNACPARRDAKPSEMLRSPIFYLMYLMFFLVAAGGLVTGTANMTLIAADYHVDKAEVIFFGVTAAALTTALSVDRLLNGLCRPFFGWVSDVIGREQTMFIAFFIEGMGFLLLMQFGTDPYLFVIITGLVFFTWGEIYSLFPATLSDTFGSKYATTNYGFLYTAKGTAALLTPYTVKLKESLGSWDSVMVTAAIFSLVAALLAIFVLKPMRKRLLIQG
jgi:OFA family oxalate/formate antiporter-like MFS transporter